MGKVRGWECIQNVARERAVSYLVILSIFLLPAKACSNLSWGTRCNQLTSSSCLNPGTLRLLLLNLSPLRSLRLISLVVKSRAPTEGRILLFLLKCSVFLDTVKWLNAWGRSRMSPIERNVKRTEKARTLNLCLVLPSNKLHKHFISLPYCFFSTVLLTNSACLLANQLLLISICAYAYTYFLPHSLITTT